MSRRIAAPEETLEGRNTDKWHEIGKMSFEQCANFIRLHGGRSYKTKEPIGDSVVDFMYGSSQFVHYKCDNIRLWCKQREAQS